MRSASPWTPRLIRASSWTSASSTRNSTTNPLRCPDLRGRVLHIGAEALDFALLQHQLQGTAIQLVHEADLQKAVAETRRTAFDAVLCDMLLGTTHGGETIAEIRTTGFRGPIIAVTAERDQASLRKAKQLGASEVLLKPYSPATLVGILSERLSASDSLSSSAEPILSTLPRDCSLAPLIVDFVKAVKAAAAAIRVAAEQGNMEQVRSLCLQLQGNGSSYGFKIPDRHGRAGGAGPGRRQLDRSGGATPLSNCRAICRRMEGRPGPPEDGHERRGSRPWDKYSGRIDQRGEFR